MQRHATRAIFIMPLYTFVADYAGGTFISQVKARNPKFAVLTWAQNLDVGAIPGLGDKSREKLLQDLRRDAKVESLYVPLNGLTNVWCVTALVRGKLMLIHFVETGAAT